MASTTELFCVQPACCSTFNIKRAACNHGGEYKYQQVRASPKAGEDGTSNHGILWKVHSSLRKSSPSAGCRKDICTSKFSAAEAQPGLSSKARRKRMGNLRALTRVSRELGEGNYFPSGFVLCLSGDKASAPKTGVVEESKSSSSLGLKDTWGQSATGTPLDVTSSSQALNPFVELRIAKRWTEIQGVKNWEGLIQPRPIDEYLAGELIRYGEFAKATYDALDQNTDSKYCGSCKKGKKRLLEFLGLENRGYTIVRYIYCTSTVDLPKFFCKPTSTPDEEKWSKDSNWMGFIAVCTDDNEIARLGRRDILLAWRGTVTYGEWIGDLETSLCPTETIQGKPPNLKPGSREPKVESGFWSMYTSKKGSRYNQTSAAEQVLDSLTELMKKYRGEDLSVTITGHSLGGALAILSAHDIALKLKKAYLESPYVGGLHARYNGEESTTLPIPVTVYTFGGPRVGNNAFRDQVLGLGVKVLRVVNVHDIVPRVPGLLLVETFKFLVDCAPNFIKNRSIVKFLYQSSKVWFIFKYINHLLAQLPSTYCHIGNALMVDNLSSCLLRCKTEPVCAHDLRSYLHLVKSNSALASDRGDNDYESLLQNNKCLCKVDDDGEINKDYHSDKEGKDGDINNHQIERKPEDIPENDHKLILL